MRLFVWAFRAFIFFTLFAFALNNQQPTTVHWFFGAQWHAPLVIIVLLAFAAGAAVGVLAMLPSWWRQRRELQRLAPPVVTEMPTQAATSVLPSEFGPEHPPREGL